MEHNKYADISLASELKKYFGFDSFKGNQEDIIRNVLNGNDTFVLMPTGGGKSLCYQLPALIMDGTCIIVSPLIALMKNQVDSIRGFSIDEGIAHFLNSSLNRAQIATVKQNIIEGRTKMLYVAPESLTKEENIQFLKQIKISFYAIDEAHCISEWGHDFRPEYRRIRAIVSEIGIAPIITLTATATPKVQNDIQKNLGMLNANVFKSSFNRPNLYYEIRPKVNAVKEIIKFIKNNEGKSGIIYCLSRKRVEDVAEILKINGIKALAYHAGMDSATRSENQDRFLMEDVDVIVATIAFGMGIDKPDVRFVIHFDIPKSLEGYYQETGRGGRDMGEGQCIAFYSYKDVQRLEKFMQGKPIAEQEIGKQLLFEIVAYAESAVCRRKTLLNYFGEEYEEPNCGNCDNCLHPKEKFEGKEDMLLVLELIFKLNEKFKAEHIINIICGERDSMTKSYKHEELEEFGIGRDQSQHYWNAIIRQGLILHFIEKEIENYGLLRIGEKGHEFLKNPHSLMLMRDHEYTESDDIDDLLSTRNGTGGAADEELFAMLKDLNKSISKKLNVPPHVLFQETSLDDMATRYPVTIDELKDCQGVGEGKAKKYGQEFVELIARYVEEKEIERPLDMVVKSMGYKSGAKVFVIQSIDHKLPLDEIAHAKNIEMDELLTEIEAIVNSGTKLNIDYYINYTIDDDRRDDIYDYLRNEATNESIEEIMDELGGDYTEEEVRLMRIKLMSEFN
ncbi:MAG: DNA helicase RecQ [Prevotellaceae bacterium]|jgi:ATP-dependent DNA helicase RecQ|nr:DNA helicase RecQ [Prevotellaceae bacterium]